MSDWKFKSFFECCEGGAGSMARLCQFMSFIAGFIIALVLLICSAIETHNTGQSIAMNWCDVGYIAILPLVGTIGFWIGKAMSMKGLKITIGGKEYGIGTEK